MPLIQAVTTFRSKTGFVIKRISYPLTLSASTNQPLQMSIVFCDLMRCSAAVWMPYFNVAIGNMFPDAALRKSEGGMKEYEKICFGVFAPRFCSLRHGSHHFSDTLTVNQVCIGIFSITALAFIAGGMNAIYQIERLPLMVAILIHGSVLYISYLGTYLLNDWLVWGVMPIVVFSAIFVVGYVVIWAIIYSITKRSTEKLNEMLKQKQQNP